MKNVNASTGKLTLANMKSAWEAIEKNGSTPDHFVWNGTIQPTVWESQKQINFKEIGKGDEFKMLDNLRKGNKSVDDYIYIGGNFNSGTYGIKTYDSLKKYGKLTGISGV